MTTAVRFDDFTGGEVGRLGVAKAKPNMFAAKNMMRFADGTIGPRPGLKFHSTTGMPTGEVHGLDWIGFPGRLLALGVGTGVYARDTDGDGAIIGGAITTFTPVNAPHGDAPERTKFVVNDPNGWVWFTAPGVKTWRVWWPDATQLSEIQVNGASAGFNGIKLYGDRLFLFSQHISQLQPPHRVWFSNAGQFHQFPSTNYVDLPGYYWEAYAMIPIGNHAFFPQRQSGWVSWIGASPASLEVRRTWTDPPELATGNGMVQTAFLLEAGKCWWLQRNGLCVTDGATYDQTSYAHLGFTSAVPTDIGGCVLPGPSKDLVLVNRWSDQVLARHWDTWTFHEFAVNLTGHVCRTEFGDRFLFAVKPTSGPPQLASWHVGLERPGLVTDQYAQPGDGTTTPVDARLTLPEYNDPEGLDVRVRQLRVDVIKYASTCGFTAQVVAANVSSPQTGLVSGDVPSTAQPVTLSGGAPSGVSERVVLNYGDQGWAGSFQVRFTGVHGLSIKGVVVVTDRKPHRELR